MSINKIIQDMVGANSIANMTKNLTNADVLTRHISNFNTEKKKTGIVCGQFKCGQKEKRVCK